jgi:hypothetical protein
MIREMALQQKQKRQKHQGPGCQLSWNCRTAAATTGGI